MNAVAVYTMSENDNEAPDHHTRKHKRSFSLTKEHVRQFNSSSQDSLSQDDTGSDAESADVFASLGANILPWHRATVASKESTESARKIRKLSEESTVVFKELSDMTKQVYESFSSQEAILQTSYKNTRFYMIENFVSTEMLKYELLLKDLREGSNLKLSEEVDIKFSTDVDTQVKLEELRDQKIADIKTTWLMKIIKAGEDFNNKSSLVRSMFRSCNNFFNELNVMEFQYLAKKHIREVAKQAILNKLKNGENQSLGLTDRLNEIETFQQKELQTIKYHDLKEIYVRMLKKEWSAMDNHLTMLETLYQMLYRIYVDVMNMKIRHTHDWYSFRERQDKSKSEVLERLKESCFAEFQDRKDDEREVELREVKRSAEEDREQRLKSFDDAEAVVSSELVFGITMKKNKNLCLIDDTSSEGTFDMHSDDIADVQNGKNEAFLKLIHQRMQIKSLIEAKYKALLSKEVTTRQHNERLHLDANRKRERDYLKQNMEQYFTKEKELENRIQLFLTEEKAAIDTLRFTQIKNLESVVETQELYIHNVRDKDSHMMHASSKQRTGQPDAPVKNENMIAAHIFHEVRNATASILCLGENLREDPTALFDILNEQSDICKYVLDVCNDMIDISKLKDVGHRLHKNTINISHLFDTVIRIQGVRAQPGVTIVKQVDSEFSEVVTDRKLLLQLMVNLTSNACKFTSVGSITFYSSVIITDGVKRLKVGVADTGKGVRQDINEKVNSNSKLREEFLETHSEQSTSTADYTMTEYSIRNSGYGLYLASTVAAVLGSKLKVISPVNIDSNADGIPVHEGCPGSFFYIVLPLYERPRSISTEPASTHRHWKFCPSGSMKVLIVDDQKLLRQAMILIFNKLCQTCDDLTVTIDTACSGEEALRMMESREYHFISMDEFYDNTMLYKNVPFEAGSSIEYPSLVFTKDAAVNKTRYLEFTKTKERFVILATDGKLLGTEAIRAMDKGNNPIIVSCTGSDMVDSPYMLKKPYDIHRLRKLFEDNYLDFIRDGSVFADGDCLRKSKDLILYQIKDD